MLNDPVSLGILMGCVSAGVAAVLDAFMDHGHILWRVRRWRAMRALQKAPMEEQRVWMEKYSEALDGGFHDRLQQVSDLYWELARWDPKLVAWICSVCMSYRVLIFAIMPAFVLYTVLGAYTGSVVIPLVLSVVANLIAIRLINAIP